MSAKFRACLASATLCVAWPLAAAPPSVGGCQIFPANHYWNTPIDQLPVDTVNSANWVSSINLQHITLHPDWGTTIDVGIPFVTVPGTQPKVPITFAFYDESDPGPYPIPPNVPIEGAPDPNGDRHALIIDTGNCRLYEIYRAFSVGGGTSWTADSGAVFDLNSNALRPSSWTSADASGLAIFPGLVRYEEVLAGEIAHAIRFTAPRIWGSTGSGHKYIWPARHWSGNLNDPLLPPMGARFRLKASYDISGFDARTQVILRAFKKYGMVLVDGGQSWFFQGVSDPNWPAIVDSQLKSIPGNQFEVVNTSLLQIDANSALAVQVPGAPGNVTAVPGSSQAVFSFTAPANGGSPITSHTVTCNPGAKAASASASPITLTGLTNGVALTCAVTAANVTGSGAASAAISVTPGLPTTVPGAPTIGAATAGNAQAMISFSPPVSDGGSAITAYTATCNPGGVTATAAASPVNVTNLVNDTLYTCSVTARNIVGASTPSATAGVTPSATVPPALIGVVSRKSHAATGTFDVVIDGTVSQIGGPLTVEPRAIGTGHAIVFQFNNALSAAGSASVVDGLGASVAASSALSVSPDDIVVTIPILVDNKRITISLTGVGGPTGTPTVPPVSIGFLVGDVNSTRSVDSSDISRVKARSGQATTSANFMFDVNATGAINSSDISAVKARSGLVLP